MVKLFIIADDLTGALDTGVKFSENGLHTVVVPLAERAFSMPVDENVDVLVVNADSRCMTPLEAYDRVYRLALLAKKLDAEIIYKKVDSALRGNIGSELSAMLDAGDGAILLCSRHRCALALCSVKRPLTIHCFPTGGRSISLMPERHRISMKSRSRWRFTRNYTFWLVVLGLLRAWQNICKRTFFWSSGSCQSSGKYLSSVAA